MANINKTLSRLVFTDQDTVLTSGNLVLSLLSGTNQGFRTRCNMTNIELRIMYRRPSIDSGKG